MSKRRQYTKCQLDEVLFGAHEHLITLAEDGNIAAAKTLLVDASILLQHGKSLPEPLGSYIGEALHRAAAVSVEEGLEANEALHLKRGRGKNKYTGVFERHLICMEVRLAYLSAGRLNTTGKGEGAPNRT